MSLARRMSRQWRHDQDVKEQTIRRARRYRHCYVHALRTGEIVAATHGDLCKEHFDEITFSHPGVTPV